MLTVLCVCLYATLHHVRFLLFLSCFSLMILVYSMVLSGLHAQWSALVVLAERKVTWRFLFFLCIVVAFKAIINGSDNVRQAEAVDCVQLQLTALLRDHFKWLVSDSSCSEAHSIPTEQQQCNTEGAMCVAYHVKSCAGSLP